MKQMYLQNVPCESDEQKWNTETCCGGCGKAEMSCNRFLNEATFMKGVSAELINAVPLTIQVQDKTV